MAHRAMATFDLLYCIMESPMTFQTRMAMSRVSRLWHAVYLKMKRHVSHFFGSLLYRTEIVQDNDLCARLIAGGPEGPVYSFAWDGLSVKNGFMSWIDAKGRQLLPWFAESFTRRTRKHELTAELGVSDTCPNWEVHMRDTYDGHTLDITGAVSEAPLGSGDSLLEVTVAYRMERHLDVKIRANKMFEDVIHDIISTVIDLMDEHLCDRFFGASERLGSRWMRWYHMYDPLLVRFITTKNPHQHMLRDLRGF